MCHPPRARAIDRGLENRAMAEMDAVEITEGDDRVGMARKRVEVANYLHSIVAPSALASVAREIFHHRVSGDRLRSPS